MVDDYGSFVTAGGIAHPAAVPVRLQNLLTQAVKVLLILPPERVTDSKHPMREDLDLSTSAMHRVLFGSSHLYTRSVLFKTTTSTSQP